MIFFAYTFTHRARIESKKTLFPARVKPHTLVFCIGKVSVRQLGTIPKYSARWMNVEGTGIKVTCKCLSWNVQLLSLNYVHKMTWKRLQSSLYSWLYWLHQLLTRIFQFFSFLRVCLKMLTKAVFSTSNCSISIHYFYNVNI